MDELLPQQAAHHVGAEVNNVLDLPEGLLHRLEGKNARQLDSQAGKQVISCSSVTSNMLTEQRRYVSSLRHRKSAQVFNHKRQRVILDNRPQSRSTSRCVYSEHCSRPQTSPHVKVGQFLLFCFIKPHQKKSHICLTYVPYWDPVGIMTHFFSSQLTGFSRSYHGNCLCRKLLRLDPNLPG